AWEDFGDYQGIEIKDGTITIDKLAFLEKTKNLFNKETALLDTYLNSNGALVSGAGYFASDWIPVSPNKTIVFPKTSSSLMCQTYTRSSDTPLTVVRVGYDEPVNTVTLDSNIERIRVWGSINLLETLQIEYGTVATPYEPFGTYIPNN